MRQPDKTIINAARKFAAAYYRKHKHEPEHQGCHPSHLGAEAIRAASEKFNVGFGSEGFTWDCGREGVTYLNMGDTYAYTVLFHSRSERFTTGCLGGTVESLERNGVVID